MNDRDDCGTCRDLRAQIELAVRFNDRAWAYRLRARLSTHQNASHGRGGK